MDDDQLRFKLELEFVQCLANPQYLQFIAQSQYFEDPAFINYLKYLLYWKEPKYAQYIIFPYCLEMLELLQHEDFRKMVASQDIVKFIHQKEYYHWESYRKQNTIEPISKLQDAS
ncbi:mediator complex, subunit Med31 [Gorgonomyces haynaldii]|nr:mediator complex, subunit Med31 [Gorgonomyces haynaldii]